MAMTYKVHIHKTEIYEGKRGNTYYVRWSVDGKRCKKPFKNATQADSFRSALVTAARNGEAFDTDAGLPVSMLRTGREMGWYEFACAFVDMKWPRVAATTRFTHAVALTTITPLMLNGDKGKPDAKLIRVALMRWAFNTSRRGSDDCPADMQGVLRWIKGHTLPVSALAKPNVLRSVLDGLTVKLDGTPAAPSAISRKRKILNTAVEYAVELGLLTSNPIPALKWTAPRTVHAVDRRSVANPVQARTLIAAVRSQPRSGPRLAAFFGCLYFAAMRPEEAVSLAKHNLHLPSAGWGEFTLDTAEPYAGREWTDSGRNRDRRHLKQRARGETRTVPCPPELTALLWEHITAFGYGKGGRLFRGERNDEELPKLTITRAWSRARAAVFVPEIAASPLAATPYDLRHAAVSTWLNGGVPPTQVAEWAGHSVEILLKIYAKSVPRPAAEGCGHAACGEGASSFLLSITHVA
jgi:integrase